MLLLLSVEKQARKFKLFMQDPLPDQWQNQKPVLVSLCSSPCYVCQPSAMFRLFQLMKHKTMNDKLLASPRPALRFQGEQNQAVIVNSL